MAYRTVTALILAAVGGSSLSAVEINQTLYGETLVEGIFQENYIHPGQSPAPRAAAQAFHVTAPTTFGYVPNWAQNQNRRSRGNQCQRGI